MVGDGRWRALWVEAQAAQRAGRISKAATLCARIAEAELGAEPPDGKALHEVGSFLLALNRDLAGLESLNDEHRARFGFASEQLPPADPLLPVGRRGWDLAQRCLLAASLGEPDRIESQLSLAELLEWRGELSHALHWRRNIARLRPDMRDNRIALGRLLEAVDSDVPTVHDRGISMPAGELPSPADATGLARARARKAWSCGERIAGLQSYLAALAPHIVPTLPIEYELCGGYKVLFHAGNGKFLAVPRHVAEFTIIDGAVYVVTGMARLSHRSLPPWMVATALRLRVWADFLVRRRRMPPRALRILKAAILALSRHAAVRHTLRLVATLGWRRYLVHGVLVADRRENLLDLIDGQSATRTSRTGTDHSGRTEDLATAQRGSPS